MLAFMEKPSRKLYPSYYQVIAEPIDMLTIESNIKEEKYQSESELIQDFKVTEFPKERIQLFDVSVVVNVANLSSTVWNGSLKSRRALESPIFSYK